MKSILVFSSDVKGVIRQGSPFNDISYAIPTKIAINIPLQLQSIAEYVTDFKAFAIEHPEMFFNVTRIGCVVDGYTDLDIAPLFKGAPSNSQLPKGWRHLNQEKDSASAFVKVPE